MYYYYKTNLVNCNSIFLEYLKYRENSKLTEYMEHIKYNQTIEETEYMEHSKMTKYMEYISNNKTIKNIEDIEYRNVMENMNNIEHKNTLNIKNEIDYLGFTFNGKEIVIRDKAITKYYYRLYKKLNTIKRNHGYTKEGNKITCENLYRLYSKKGAKTKGKQGYKYGNFITYVQRSQIIFGIDEPITRKTKKHMLKIRRRLDEVELEIPKSKEHIKRDTKVEREFPF